MQQLYLRSSTNNRKSRNEVVSSHHSFLLFYDGAEFILLLTFLKHTNIPPHVKIINIMVLEKVKHSEGNV